MKPTTRQLLKLPWPIMGMHGRSSLAGGGWTVVTVEHGHNPNDKGGADFSDILNAGRRVIVRMNNGYGEAGTIPIEEHYRDGAIRAARFVEGSKGADVWIVGNEWNTSWERPVRPDGSRPFILPGQYARYYNLCREQIRNVPGHYDDIVLFAPVGPWNPETTYPGNERGDWLRSYQDAQVEAKDICGFAWHAYDRRQDPRRLALHHYMTAPGWSDHHWEFRVFEDWERATLAKYRDCYKFITEFDANEPWKDENRGYFLAAAKVIEDHNATIPDGVSAIQSLVAYRWEYDKWYIKGRKHLIADYTEAVAANITAPGYLASPPVDPPEPTGNTWSLAGTLTGPDGQMYDIEGSVTSEKK